MRIDRVKLLVALEERNLNQKQLAKKTGLSRSTIYGIRSGRSCSDKSGEAIARALNVPLEQLI